MQKRFKASEVYKILGISRRTLGRMLANNEIESEVINNRHYFYESEINKHLNIISETKRDIYLYSRVSSHNQKTELETQQNLLNTFATVNGYVIKDHFSDIGSGINFKRKNFLKLLDLIIEGKVSKIIITYEDRLCRFAFDLLKEIFGKFNCEIIVINNKTTSPQEELIEDLMTIIHVFSSRLYGLRRNRRQIDELCRTSED